MVDWLLVGEQEASFIRRGWKSTKKGKVKDLCQTLRRVDDMCFTCFVFSSTSNIVWLIYMYMYMYVMNIGFMLEIIKERGCLTWLMKYDEIWICYKSSLYLYILLKL